MRLAHGLALHALVVASLAAADTSAAASKRRSPVAPQRVSIQVDVNGLFATVRPDATVAPASTVVGAAEQFELYDLGHGLVAFRSVANGRFLSAEAGRPLLAAGLQIGGAETFRSVGAPPGLSRLRSLAAKQFVCAADAGQSALAASRHCPHRWQLLAVAPIQLAPTTLQITDPAPGTALRARTVTFRWSQGGDESWIKVGTLPGASDVFASESLRTAAEQTIPGLPLSGEPLYVQVTRRTGTLVESATAQYTAPVRKGLAIVANFADRRLEDWAGAGIKSEDDLSRQLRQMEAHWEWLSRGLEKFRWDIVRIQLAEPAVPDAYSGWIAFRDAVGTLARQQVETADYDVDVDGVIDAAWVIVSSGDQPVPFAIGGTSRNADVNLFVDGQASGSVVAGATGNFNHELGHCLGLPDMYGRYSTLNKLTFMNDSWAMPPHDFSAYERLKLGWISPQVLTRSTPGVWLPSANEELAAAMIPTNHPLEYFLIEYRKPPASGFGSAIQNYRGLAVYHVLENSSMWQDPPVVKLEPADGAIVPDSAFDPYDFVYSGNPRQQLPMTLRSYYNERDVVFQISRVVDQDNGVAFDVTIAPQPSANLLTNGSFETGTGSVPEGWTPGWYVPQDAAFSWPATAAFTGRASAFLESATGNDIYWAQTVTTIVPGEPYQLCGMVKGEGIQGVQGSIGANVSVLGEFIHSDAPSGTFDWTRSCVAFTGDLPVIDVACRLGFYGSTAAGKLWCDELTLERARLHSAFE